MRKHLYMILSFFVLATLSEATIVGSQHDLSTTTTPEICVFCHTPHFSSTSITPLWNRKITDITQFQMYSSATLKGTPDNVPNPPSLACLSCHDGVVARNEVSAVSPLDAHALLNAPGPGLDNNFSMNCSRCHAGGGQYPPEWWSIGADLTDDHPISIPYPTPDVDPDFNQPPDPVRGWGIGSAKIKLYNGKVECPSCHDPHNNTYGRFLRVDNLNSQLCSICHRKTN